MIGLPGGPELTFLCIPSVLFQRDVFPLSSIVWARAVQTPPGAV